MALVDPNGNERVEYIRSASVPGIEILVVYNSFHPWHVFHETYTVCAAKCAAAGWRYRSREYFLGDRGTMLMEPGEFHRNTHIGKLSDFKVIMFDREIIHSAASELGIVGVPHLCAMQIDDPLFFTAVYSFCAAAQSSADALTQQSRLATCIRLLLDRAEKRPLALNTVDAHGSIERAKAHIRLRYNEPISLDELSAVAGLSKYHLVREFSRHAGISPHAFQTHIRVTISQALLKAGIAPGEVAVQVGFSDQSHLTRHFRRVMRMTPARYMQSVR